MSQNIEELKGVLRAKEEASYEKIKAMTQENRDLLERALKRTLEQIEQVNREVRAANAEPYVMDEDFRNFAKELQQRIPSMRICHINANDELSEDEV
jgi:hypothetical protein